MKVLQINAVYGYGSTGVIVKDLQDCCIEHGIDCYVAFPKGMGKSNDHTYEIGCTLDRKLHAFLCRLAGKQSYFSCLATRSLLKYIGCLQPDIVHLHNLHSNYIHLNMLLKYLAENDIRTIITMHDCWYFTGGCFHFASVGCDKWQYGCGNCIKKMQDTPALLYDASASILKDRVKYLNAIPKLSIVGCSEWIANECKKSVLKDCDIRFIHNGFDLNVFKPSPSDLRNKLGLEGKYVILGPASKWLLPINEPTLNYFIDNMTDDMVLVLFGCNGTEKIQSDKVKTYGFTRNREELAQLYSMADVMVNVSREDTLSSLNLECQACGTPVVTYDATGSKETVDSKCGFAVETGNHEVLFNSVTRIKTQSTAPVTESCRKWILDNFERFLNYVRYIELYKNQV
jgi:putative colanic acid biosynthesis glycosyltransferase